MWHFREASGQWEGGWVGESPSGAASSMMCRGADGEGCKKKTKSKLRESGEEKEAGKALQTWSNSYDVHGDLSREREGPDPTTLETFCGDLELPRAPSTGRCDKR